MNSRPPRLPLRFFRWFCHPDYREDIEGDLVERFEARVRHKGKTRVSLMFAWEVLLLLRPAIVRPLSGHNYLNNYGMLKNHIKIAWRNILRRKAYSAINVAGLALGICASLAIYTVTSYDLTFDTFHPDVDRIYRLVGEETETTGDQLNFCRVPLQVAEVGHDEVSGIEVIAGITPYNAAVTIPGSGSKPEAFESRLPGSHYITTGVTSSRYFDIFKYEWLAGNPATSLDEPFSVVISESKARQYFGNESPNQVMGRQIIYDDSLQVSVTGVVKDWEGNTDIAFTDFISAPTLQSRFLKSKINTASWGHWGMNTWTFVKVQEEVNSSAIELQFAALVSKYADPEVRLRLWMEPLTSIHFNDQIIENPIRTAHLSTLYVLIGIAASILLLAVLNFINLSTAQSIQRAREMGIRKVLGSSRTSIMVQFLTETTMVTLFAAVLAVAMVTPLLQLFEAFIPAGVGFHLFQPATILFLITTVVLTSLLAGIYPAKQASLVRPVVSLKGGGTQRGGEKWLLRRALIIFQFSVSLVFIIGSLVISKQLYYVQNKDLGFEPANIVTFASPRGASPTSMDVLVDKIRQTSGVENVTRQWLAPMTGNARGMKLKFDGSDEKDFWVTQVAGDENYIPLYGINLLAGRNLTPTDRVNELVVNQSLANVMGVTNPADALGRTLYWNDQPYPIVGVVADFHTASLHDLVTPLCVINRPDREWEFAVKAAGSEPGALSSILPAIQKAWEEVYPGAVPDFRVYQDSVDALYEKDQQAASLINASMLVAIFISCIGLFGLTLFTTLKRAREISIRKVLGASVMNITSILSREFMVLVLLAMLVASPIAWYAGGEWLSSFAYRTEITWWIFVVAACITTAIALLTVGTQAVKAALVNLRNE
jgi:putative ABC transport system permease protein